MPWNAVPEQPWSTKLRHANAPPFGDGRESEWKGSVPSHSSCESLLVRLVSPSLSESLFVQVSLRHHIFWRLFNSRQSPLRRATVEATSESLRYRLPWPRSRAGACASIALGRSTAQCNQGGGGSTAAAASDAPAKRSRGGVPGHENRSSLPLRASHSPHRQTRRGRQRRRRGGSGRRAMSCAAWTPPPAASAPRAPAAVRRPAHRPIAQHRPPCQGAGAPPSPTPTPHQRMGRRRGGLGPRKG